MNVEYLYLTIISIGGLLIVVFSFIINFILIANKYKKGLGIFNNLHTFTLFRRLSINEKSNKRRRIYKLILFIFYSIVAIVFLVLILYFLTLFKII